MTFMGNPCGYSNCMSTECEKCPHYRPTFFGMRVPRWLGNILFRIESYIKMSQYMKENVDELRRKQVIL